MSKRLLDKGFRITLQILAVLPLLAVIAIVAVLIFSALPAITYNGFGFLIHSSWKPGNFYANPITSNGVLHPPGVNYGGLFLIVGTIACALIAVVIGVPVSVFAAIVLARKIPPRFAGFFGLMLEAIAGIPSVVFGLWGALTLGPYLAHHVYPLIANNVPDWGFFKFFRGPTGNGEGLLSAGIVLAVMIVPIIASTSRELIKQVPASTRDGAKALGLTDTEVLFAVDLRWVASGVLGASVLGLGRALGETMAVAMVTGSSLGSLPKNVYDTMTTIAATIVSQLDSALSDTSNFAVETLAEAALLLMLITLIVNLFARLLIKRVSATALPVGRGL
jgi:phosphate transport system permease protein